MTEPLQTTIDGEEVPYRQTLPPPPGSKLKVTLNVEAGGEITDLTMLEATGEEDVNSVTSARELVALWKEQYRSPEGMLRDWYVELYYEIFVAVHDPATGKSTTATWRS